VKGCLFTLALGAAVLLGGVWFGAPPLAEALVRAALPAGLQGAATVVTVRADPPTDLLRLHAETVSIRAPDARLGDIASELVELELEDVDLGSRRAARITGEVTGATVEAAGGTLDVPTIRFTGDSDVVRAVASIDASSAEAHIAARVADATGRPAGDVQLSAPNALIIGIDGVPVAGTLDVNEDGSLRMTLVGPLAVEVELLAPGATPMDLRAVRVAGDRLVLEGDVDPAQLLG
jgi:hypothetical protein